MCTITKIDNTLWKDISLNILAGVKKGGNIITVRYIICDIDSIHDDADVIALYFKVETNFKLNNKLWKNTNRGVQFGGDNNIYIWNELSKTAKFMLFMS